MSTPRPGGVRTRRSPRGARWREAEPRQHQRADHPAASQL